MEQLERLNSDKDETIRRHDVTVTSLETSLAESRDVAAAKIKELESATQRCGRLEQLVAASTQKLGASEASRAAAEQLAAEKQRELEELTRMLGEFEASNNELRTSVVSVSSRLDQITRQLDNARFNAPRS